MRKIQEIATNNTLGQCLDIIMINQQQIMSYETKIIFYTCQMRATVIIV